MKYIVGNWKMKNTLPDVNQFIKEFNEYALNKNIGVNVGLAPMFPFIMPMQKEMNVDVFAQNVSAQEEGAFTGEVSAKALKSLGVAGAIVAHSERRNYFLEDDTIASAKIKQLLNNQLKVIFCVGETLKQYQDNQTLAIVKQQLQIGLSQVQASDLDNIIIAYEPVWAIGTGLVCPLDQANNVCLFIQEQISAKFKLAPTKIKVLYGGSVDPKNVAQFIACPAIAGVLVGGASVKASSFIALIEACQ